MNQYSSDGIFVKRKAIFLNKSHMSLTRMVQKIRNEVCEEKKLF